MRDIININKPSKQLFPMAYKHILLKLDDGITDTTPEVVEEVKRLQQLLKDWGTLSADEAIDGKFGPKTQQAVKLFQEKRSLSQDGIVGQKTWAALLKVSPSEVEIIPRPVTGAVFSGNKGIVYQQLRNQGFSSNVQIAAIMGAMQQESSFNPYAQEGPAPKGLGLFQWSFERRKKVPTFTNNVTTDIRNQIQLFVNELNTTEKVAGRTLRSATTLAQAMLGMKQYERYGIAGRREEYARKILDQLS